MAPEVRWAWHAALDLQSIAAFVAQRAPMDARKLLKRLRDRAATLRDMPERGRVVPELARLGVFGLRELVVRPYRILYRHEAGQVSVVAVIDGRRDLMEVLHERLLRL